MHSQQIRIYKSMAPEQKLQIALRLYYSARRLKLESLRVQHPDWTERALDEKVRELFLYARN